MGSQEGVSVPVMIKLNKISSYLSSFQANELPFTRRTSLTKENENEPQEGNCGSEKSGAILPAQQNESISACPSPTSDKISAYYNSDVKEPLKLPLSNLRQRIKTFGNVCWLLPIDILSVYECARRGWYLLEQDMLCCCCCSQMVCLQLPPSHSSSYKHSLSILCNRVRTKHRGNCRYQSCPDPMSMCRPPTLLTTPHLYSLAAAAHQLTILAPSVCEGTQLPYLENKGKDIMDRLGISSAEVQEVWGSVCDNDWQQVAVLLVLCGWKATTTSDTIRCELCQRSIGLWHFLSYAEYLQREVASASIETEPPIAEITVGSTQNTEAMPDNSENLSQKPVDENSADKLSDVSPVSKDTEMGDSMVNKSPGKQTDSTETPQSGEGVDTSVNQHKDVETDNFDSELMNSSSKDESNNSTIRTEPDAGSGNKRKRSECDDESNKEDQSVSAAKAVGEGALPSKRSKTNEDEQQLVAGPEPSPASSSDVSGEKSSTSRITQEPSKPLFCPFSQHRFWCGWITSEHKHLMNNGDNTPSNANTAATGHSVQAGGAVTGAHSADRGAAQSSASPAVDTLPGYSVFGRQLKSVLQLAMRKRWTTSDKYSNTIDGLRSVRAHLNSWAK